MAWNKLNFDEPLVAISAEDLRGRKRALKFYVWVLWGLGFAVSACVTFLWLVFGLAAAAGGQTSGFLAGTAFVSVLLVVGSVFALTKGRFLIGLSLIWIVPLPLLLA